MTAEAVSHLPRSHASGSLAPARFAEAVVLVTGAASGVGAAAAALFAGEGALVVAADTSPDHHIVDEIARAGGSAICIQEDLRLPDAARLLVSDVLEIYGRLDILIHTMANPFLTDTAELPSVSAALHSGYRMARAAMPAIRRSGGGSMLFAATIPGSVEHPEATPQWAARRAFLTQIRTLAARYASSGIRVNGIHPTAGNGFGPPAGDGGKRRSRSAVDALSAAATLAYLVSSDARFTTGQILTVDAQTRVALRQEVLSPPLPPIRSTRDQHF